MNRQEYQDFLVTKKGFTQPEAEQFTKTILDIIESGNDIEIKKVKGCVKILEVQRRIKATFELRQDN